MENLQNIISSIKAKSQICGIASDQVNLAKDLVSGKCKDKSLFVCEGLWASDKLIQKNFEIPLFLISSERLEGCNDKNELEQILRLAKFAKQTFIISQKACKKISDRDGEDEYFVVVKSKSFGFSDLEALIKNKQDILAIITDGLEQPGNIGAILRSFDCAGGDFAIITNAKAKLNNSRLIRASLGASFMLPCIQAEINEVQEWLVKNNFRCVVTDLSSKKSYREVSHKGRIAIVAGNEHTGISASWRTLKNAEPVIIPMLGSCESLNVGFASTLVAYEIGLKKFEEKSK